MQAIDPAARSSGVSQIPVTVLGGYLGAGKTTLLNQLLRNAGSRRLTVLVNDFGSVNIDADLVEARDGEMLRLAGGCVCCSFGSDLMAALAGLRERVPRPGHVVIETSGVALPAAVASTVRLADHLHLAGCVVLLDASVIRRQIADPYVGDLVLGQMRQADLLLLHKVDLVDAAQREALCVCLGREAPGVPLFEAEHGQVPPELVLDPDLASLPNPPHSAWRVPAGDGPSVVRPRHADGLFRSRCFPIDAPVDLHALAAALQKRPCGLVRAKGWLRDRDDRPWLLQLAGDRVDVSEWRGDPAVSSQLVCIGLAALWDAPGLGAQIESFRWTEPAT